MHTAYIPMKKYSHVQYIYANVQTQMHARCMHTHTRTKKYLLPCRTGISLGFLPFVYRKIPIEDSCRLCISLWMLKNNKKRRVLTQRMHACKKCTYTMHACGCFSLYIFLSTIHMHACIFSCAAHIYTAWVWVFFFVKLWHLLYTSDLHACIHFRRQHAHSRALSYTHFSPDESS